MTFIWRDVLYPAVLMPNVVPIYETASWYPCHLLCESRSLTTRDSIWVCGATILSRDYHCCPRGWSKNSARQGHTFLPAWWSYSSVFRGRGTGAAHWSCKRPAVTGLLHTHFPHFCNHDITVVYSWVCWKQTGAVFRMAFYGQSPIWMISPIGGGLKLIIKSTDRMACTFY